MRTQPPTISVLMPVYNAEKYLEIAIESILNQSFQDFEFIIINDGSTDNSESIIKSFSDPRIRYVKNAENLKLIKTLNKGIELATGKYIARMDADDVAEPNLFKEQLAIFQSEHADVVAVRTTLLSYDGKSKKRNISKIKLLPTVLRFIIPFQNVVGHPGVMAKTELMKKYKYCDDGTVDHFEDLDLWNRMLQENALIEMLDSPLFLWRQNPTGITKNLGVLNETHQRKYDYCKRTLKNQFDFEFKDHTLKLLFFPNENPSFNSLCQLRKELTQYTKHISEAYSLSLQEISALQFWSNHFFTTTLIRKFKRGTKNKISVSLAFVSTIPLLLGQNYFSKLSRTY